MFCSRFTLHDVRTATLRVLGLGCFHCYINGARVSDELHLPLVSAYERRPNVPVQETLTGYRIYVPTYDVTRYLREGENVLTIHFGGGFYTYKFDGPYGTPKAVFRLFGEGGDGAFDIGSCAEDRIAPSFAREVHMTFTETQDFTRAREGALAGDEACASFGPVCVVEPPESEYVFSDCPTDGVVQVLPVQVIAHNVAATAYSTRPTEQGRRIVTVTGEVYDVGRLPHATVYDCGKNTSGYPVLRVTGKAGEVVRVTFSEERLPNGTLDDAFTHGQHFTIVCDGSERCVTPSFVWFGFRYVAVVGPAVLTSVEVVHAKVELTGRFVSDNDTLNWLHDTFVNTQLTNMHGGIPSDCPHLERRGYTGDGQLICHSAMCVLQAEAFYRKWVQDILDSQDTISGHVQYTAPYTRSGGGPVGWGCAVVEVPYQLYRHYGDRATLAAAYPAMKRYFDFMEAHSARGLVLSDKEGEWCLGDWCPPTEVVIPAPFVNNYFYIRSLMRACEIARLLGHEEDIPLFDSRIQERCAALMDVYYNAWDGNFLGGVQGANAFALSIGLGDERTYAQLVERYRALGEFDTGIFGTELVLRTLMARGDADVAVGLLLSEGVHSFAEMRRRDATTLWEYWPQSLTDRSHNHPMFGACVGLFYEYLLGIRQAEGTVGYNELVISPVLVPQLGRLSGAMRTPRGDVCVAYERTQDEVHYTIRIPEGVHAVFARDGRELPLTAGDNHITIERFNGKGDSQDDQQ